MPRNDLVASHNQRKQSDQVLPQVLPLREASRRLVRELGFLKARDEASGLSHSQCHALIEIDAAGTLSQADLPALLQLDKSQSSRIVTELEAQAWVKAKPLACDRRARTLSITSKGRAKLATVHGSANSRVEEALVRLNDGERHIVLRGMQLYSRALDHARRSAAYSIRLAKPSDRAAIARLIRTVMPEFGASGPGFAIQDPEVDDMPGAYRRPRASYSVVVCGRAVVGGGGFAPLKGGNESVCELRKMYFLPQVRGLGLGQKLLSLCIAGAKEHRFRTMYIETLTSMRQAQSLYRRNDFQPLDGPMGVTGHFGCDAYFARSLQSGSEKTTARVRTNAIRD